MVARAAGYYKLKRVVMKVLNLPERELETVPAKLLMVVSMA